MADKIQTPVKVHAERPRARRYSFVASVELMDLQSELQFQGRATDLSLYGCGVAASKSLPSGTKLRIKITTKGRAEGDIGIVFARVEPSDQMLLEKWIGEVRDR